MSFILIYVTHPNTEEAKKVADHLLSQRAIACYNLFPIENAYWRNGVMEKGNEIVSILKTRKDNRDIVKNEIKKIHSYDTPCIIKMEVEANEEYSERIDKESKQ